MKFPNILIAKPQTQEQFEALAAVMKALNIQFEVPQLSEEQYDPAFVAKIRESKEEYEKGNFTRVEKDDLTNFLGLS
ncbi:MAG: DUF2683 family protein [Bacteroidota bacterium]